MDRAQSHGLTERSDSASYQRRPPALAERQDSASNIEALAEAERGLTGGTSEGMLQLDGRRDSAEDMQFLSPPTRGTSLRSPRRSLLMDGDSADDLPVQSLRVSSMSPPRTAGASFGRQVMRSDSARQHLVHSGRSLAIMPAASHASTEDHPGSLTMSPFQVDGSVQRFDSASDRPAVTPLLASVASPGPSSPPAAAAQLEDVPLGRKDSALDSLAAARRLVLQDEPSSVRVSDEVQQPAQRSSIARSSVHSVTSEPGTSAAMQAGPSAYQGPASPTDAEARLDFAEHLAPRQDSALDPLAAARATALGLQPPAGAPDAMSIPAGSSSHAQDFSQHPATSDPLVQARWLMARDADAEQPISSSPANPRSAWGTSEASPREQEPYALPAVSLPPLDTGLPSSSAPAWANVPSTAFSNAELTPEAGPSSPAPGHRVHRGDSASEAPLPRTDSLSRARALIRAEFPTMPIIEQSGSPSLSSQNSRLSPRSGSGEQQRMANSLQTDSAYPDSPMFAGSPQTPFSSANHNLQGTHRPGMPSGVLSIDSLRS